MAEKKFEDAMARLEEIVRQLEEGELPLEEALKVFEEGMHLIKFCTNKLEEAEKRVSVLIQDSSGHSQVPFTLEEQESE